MSEPATRSQADPMFRNSSRLTAIYGAVGAVLATGIGHAQGQHMVAAQPMTMAAAEALWERMTWSASQSSPLGFGHEFGHNLFSRPCQGIGGCVQGA
ncbi:MAG: hypothetical protein GQ526_01465, partial [Ardenticatenales bacterium]|nr:hypothetical protein [Ardenticatenales bacterium]